jgi:hypothetical protein
MQGFGRSSRRLTSFELLGGDWLGHVREDI